MDDNEIKNTLQMNFFCGVTYFYALFTFPIEPIEMVIQAEFVEVGQGRYPYYSGFR